MSRFEQRYMRNLATGFGLLLCATLLSGHQAFAVIAERSAAVPSQRGPAPVRVALTNSDPRIHAPVTWQKNAFGQGMVVAIIDSGVDSKHPFLTTDPDGSSRAHVVGQACFGTNDSAHTSLCPGGAEFVEGGGAGEPCDVTKFAPCYHGTHMAGIVGGWESQSFSGVAPQAGIFSIQVFSGFYSPSLCQSEPIPCVRINWNDVARALEYVYTKTGPSLNIVAVNLSLSVDPEQFPAACDSTMEAQYHNLVYWINRLRAVKHIAVVVAAGNSETNASAGILMPACLTKAVAIGATVNTATLGQEQLWESSDMSGQVKLLAPGAPVCSSVPTAYVAISADERLSPCHDSSGYFATNSGTSQAAAQVSGVIAVLRSMGYNTETTLELLERSGPSVTEPSGVYVATRIDLMKIISDTATLVAPSSTKAPDSGEFICTPKSNVKARSRKRHTNILLTRPKISRSREPTIRICKTPTSTGEPSLSGIK